MRYESCCSIGRPVGLRPLAAPVIVVGMFTIERAERLLLTIGGRTMRHFYALSDSSTGDNPTNYTQGSANTKEPIAFPSKTARDRWVEATRLLTAKAITRAEAIRWADTWPVCHRPP